MGRLLVLLLAVLVIAPTARAKVTEYPVPTTDSGPFAIAEGPDHALWFTENNADKVGRITASGQVTEFALPVGSGALGIAAGGDGSLWIAAHGNGSIEKLTTGGTVTTYALTDQRSPYGITTGPGGAIWFTAQPPTAGGGLTQGAVGTITPDGTITEYALTGAASTVPWWITAGPDGNLWFTEQRTTADPGYVGRITPTGTLTEFAIPTAGAIPTGIAAGADGNLWFTDQNHGMVGKATTSGQITEYAAGASSLILGIAKGPGSSMVFADPFGKAVYSVTPAGTASKTAVPGTPRDVVLGSDGAVWFTDQQGKIGRIAAGTTTAACHVPNVVGRKLARAKQILRAARCKAGPVTRRKHAGAKGVVIAQRPKAGTTVPSTRPVALTVSR